MRTSYNGQVEGAFQSLPFGEGYSANGTDDESEHFAGLDSDADIGTDHAQFRQYSPTEGRWMSPDPYDGSYDFSNPQSFNRYSYVGNMPLSYVDPTGQFTESPPPQECSGPCNLFANLFVQSFEALFSLFDDGPSFHGTLQPRSNIPNANASLAFMQIYSYPPGQEIYNLGVPFIIQVNSITSSLPDLASSLPTVDELFTGAEIVGATIGTAAVATAGLLLMEGDNAQSPRCTQEWENAYRKCS